MSDLVLILISGAIGGFRLFGIKSLFFQAIAHVWVGAMFGAGFKRDPEAAGNLPMLLAILLTVLEVIAFLVSRFA